MAPDICAPVRNRPTLIPYRTARSDTYVVHNTRVFGPDFTDLFIIYLFILLRFMGTAVAQWLRCCVKIRKVAGSIPAGVSGFFIDIKSF